MEQNIKQYLNPLVIDHKFCFSLGIRGNFLSYISCINTNNFDEISQMYRTKMIKKTRSNHYKTKLPKLRKNLKHLLNYYPDGLQIEKFSTTYQQFFNHYPDPKNYGYENVIDLLNCPKLQDILTLRKLKNGDVMINSADTTASDVFELELQCCQREIPEDTVKIFKQILESYGGGITVESVVPEYEFRTGKKLDLNEYGVNSIIELLSLLDEDFKVSRGKDNQFYLINSKINQNSDKRDGLSAQNKGDHIETCNGEENTRYPSKEICRRIYHILTEEFPQGLSLQELDATYKGFYGAYSEDLNPLNYGFRTLEALLSQESTQIRLLRQQGKVVAVADILSQEFSWQTSQLAQPKTVSLNICFPTLDTNVFSEKEFTDVVVADVYSPSKFWVIKRGKSHSEALDDLMDRMLSFYDSDMGKRFLIPTGKMVLSLGAPVAALHTEDESFYRAIVISMEDIRTAKLFFVDYGTNLSVPLVSLRLLHPMFFELPAQAIKCSLYGIEPVDKRSTWPKQVTAKFLLLIQDKAFAAYVNKIQDVGKLVLTLYDTSQAEDVNISNFLVSQRMAQYKKGISIDFASTMDQQQSEQSPKQHLQESEKLKCVDEKLSEKSLSLSSIQTSEIKEDMMEHEINPTCLDGPNKFLQKSDVILEKHSTETFKSSCTSLTLPNHSFKTSLENLSKETKVEFPILLFNEREPALRENNIKSKHFLSDHRSSLSLNNIEEKRHCQISSSKSVEGDFSDSLRHTINNNERDCQISSSKSVEGDFRDSFRHTINNNERDTSERGSELSKMGRKWFSLDCGVVISNLKGSRAKDEPECLDNSHHSTKIFFSDEEFEGESSTDSIDYRDTVVSEIEVKYGQVIHLVIKDCSLCVPIPQLLEVFGDTYLDRLEEQALSNSDANHLFEVNRTDHFHIFMILARLMTNNTLLLSSSATPTEGDSPMPASPPQGEATRHASSSVYGRPSSGNNSRQKSKPPSRSRAGAGIKGNIPTPYARQPPQATSTTKGSSHAASSSWNTSGSIKALSEKKPPS